MLIEIAVNKLSSKGLLKREISEGDLRSYKLTLTADGKQAAAQYIEAEVKLSERLIKYILNNLCETAIS